MPTVSVRTQAHGASIVIEDEGVESGKRAIGRQKRKVITVVIGDELKYHGRGSTACGPPEPRSRRRVARDIARPYLGCTEWCIRTAPYVRNTGRSWSRVSGGVRMPLRYWLGTVRTQFRTG